MSYDNEIKDFGEKIGGARKDLWRSRGLKVEDLTDLNLKEYVENITKDNIWPTPNYKEFKGQMSDVCIYFMKFVRDKAKAKIDVYADGKDRDRAEMYILFLNALREECIALKVTDDIKKFRHRIVARYTDSSGRYTDQARQTPGLDTAFLNTIDFNDSELKRFSIETEIQGFPEKFRGDLRGITIRQEYYSSSGYRISNATKYLTRETFKTEAEAIEYAKKDLLEELDGRKKTRKTSSVVNIVRPQLEHIERFGPDLRKGQNASTDHLLQAFKFRGGEFGNWNTQDDRQACLNYAFDSLVDLAYILGVPMEVISLGTLGAEDKE